MSSFSPFLPIPTGRTGTIFVYATNGHPARVLTGREITSRHVELHLATVFGELLSNCYPIAIQAMDDGGPIPTETDFVFHTGIYRGTSVPGSTLEHMWYGRRAVQQQFMPPVAQHGMQQHNAYGPQRGIRPPQHMPRLFQNQQYNPYGIQYGMHPPQYMPHTYQNQQYNPHVVHHGMQPLLQAMPAQIPQLGSVRPMEAERTLATAPAVPHQLSPTEPAQAPSAELPTVTKGDDTGAQIPISAPEEAAPEPEPEPEPEPAPPSYLKERMKHVKLFVRQMDKGTEKAWVLSMQSAIWKNQEKYCRLFWPSNEQAVIDVEWVVQHFKNFNEALLERLAIEGRKDLEELKWEEDGADIEDAWRDIRAGRTAQVEKQKRDQAKRTEEAEQRAAEVEKEREDKAKREAEKLAATEEKRAKKKAENDEERAKKQAKKDEQKRKAAAEKQRKKQEEKARKAEENAAKRAAAPSRKRKPAPTRNAPSKKRKTNAQLPSPEATDHEGPSTDELQDALLAGFENEADNNDEAIENDDDDNDDGLLKAATEALDNPDSDESDADDDEPEDIGASMYKAILKAQQEESPSKAAAQTSEPKEDSDDDSDPNFQVVIADVSDGEGGCEAEGEIDSLFNIEADEASEEESEDEDEDQEEVKPKRVQKVLSQREREIALIDAEIEELKGKADRKKGNLGFQQRCSARINRLRDQRMQWL
jgi:hypothetical protein